MITNDIWQGRAVEFHEGRVLFRTTRPFSEQEVKLLLGSHVLLRFEPIMESKNMYLLEVETKQNLKTVSLCEEVGRAKDVVWAEPDFVTKISGYAPFYPNDPRSAEQWHLFNVGAPIAWGIPGGRGNDNVRIVVLDSGIQLDVNGILSHPDLMSARFILQSNYFAPGQNLNDLIGHGTHVAGITAATADNAVGVAGINWMSEVHIYKVFGDDGRGSTSALVRA